MFWQDENDFKDQVFQLAFLFQIHFLLAPPMFLRLETECYQHCRQLHIRIPCSVHYILAPLSNLIVIWNCGCNICNALSPLLFSWYNLKRQESTLPGFRIGLHRSNVRENVPCLMLCQLIHFALFGPVLRLVKPFS